MQKKTGHFTWGKLVDEDYIASSIFPVSGIFTATDGSFPGFCKVDVSYHCLLVLHCGRQKQMMHEREEGKVDLYICELPIDKTVNGEKR